MIGLDTNVLVRYLVADDAQQHEVAARIIDTECSVENPGFIANVVLCELHWVLTRGFRYPRASALDAIESLYRAIQLEVESLHDAARALREARAAKGDFADCLIAHTNRRAGCTTTLTFDRKAARHAMFRYVD